MNDTICPDCFAKGERVVMGLERLIQPDLSPKGDRFPGEMYAIPTIYHPHSRFTCPKCGRIDVE